MSYHLPTFIISLLLQILTLVTAGQPSPNCKASPGSPSWPSSFKWNALNASVSGRLLTPSPPGAVCHPDQPTYNATLCSAVAAEWSNVDLFADDPITSAWPFWNNDSCLPWVPNPCSGEGFPVYAINATSSQDVKHDVDFARENNVRIVVKATGHDYLGRSISLLSPNTAAMTFGAGTQMGELNAVANANDLSILSGGQHGVGYGGFATGGGHSALGPTYGMAADHVLEMEIVSPDGDILTVNECQNQDLFWAIRGGGGSTFGVIISTTIAAFPSTPFLTYTVIFGTLPASEEFWDAMAYWLSQYPALADVGLAGHGGIASNTSVDGVNYGGFQGIFLLPALSPENTTDSIISSFEPILAHINTTWPGYFQIQTNATVFPSFYDWWSGSNGPDVGGVDMMVGSRLLPVEALKANLTALKVALQGFLNPQVDGMSVDFVSGKGVWNAVPRGGSNAVNPAWRKAMVHMTNAVTWNYLDPVGKAEQLGLLNTYVEALRVLAPESGAYVNEANAYEPNFQQTFWGFNYPRLLDIKRRFDPYDIFWCTPCVGNERWKQVGNDLCRI